MYRFEQQNTEDSNDMSDVTFVWLKLEWVYSKQYTRLCSVCRSSFTNVYKYDVTITSSAALNIYFLHCQNVPFLGCIHC